MSSIYLSHPTIMNNEIAFVADGDVWLLPHGSSRASRVTAGESAAKHPRLSRDGTRLGWTSRRFGNPEVVRVDLDHGEIQRMTYWQSRTTRLVCWTPNDELVILSAGAMPFTSMRRVSFVDGTGSTRPLGFANIDDISFLGDLTVILTGTFTDPAFWREYRGGAHGTIWLARGESPARRLDLGLDTHVSSPMLVDGRVVFVSDHSGVGNLYSCDLNGGDLRQHSWHKDYYVRNPSSDGDGIVYQNAGRIWRLERLTHEAHPIEVRLRTSIIGWTSYSRPVADSPERIFCSHDGRLAAIQTRGSVVVLRVADGTVVRGALPGSSTRSVEFLATDGLVWVEDGPDGEQRIGIGSARSTDGATYTSPTLAGRHITCLSTRPVGDAVAAATSDGRVISVGSDAATIEQVPVGGTGPLTGLAWAPDGSCLIWSQVGSTPTPMLWVHDPSVSETFPITDGTSIDTDPVFTNDGLWFLTRPLIEALRGGFPESEIDSHLPRPQGWIRDRHGGSWIDQIRRWKATPPVETSHRPGRYRQLATAGETLMWIRDSGAGPLLEAHRADAPDPMVLTEQVLSVCASTDGETVLALVSPAELVEFSSSGERLGATRFDRLLIEVNPVTERSAAFEDVSRTVAAQFWSASVADRDWPRIVEKYRALLPTLASDEDFVDVVRELLGELRSSHAYVNTPMMGTEQIADGQLGADLSPGEEPETGWQFVHIPVGDRFDSQARSSWSAAGVRPGDHLTSVAGRPVHECSSSGKLFSGLAGVPSLAGVRGIDSERELTVVPLADERRLRYHDWVRVRRGLVHRESCDSIGYIHVPDTLHRGWTEFCRAAATEFPRDGLIIDLRYNTGGVAAHLFLEALTRREIGRYFPRDAALYTFPPQVPPRRFVVLVNEQTGSDGELLAASLRSAGVATLIGTRTWGGSITFGPRHDLVNGVSLRVPMTPLLLHSGEPIENVGVTPDVNVISDPSADSAGSDRQLTLALEYALRWVDR